MKTPPKTPVKKPGTLNTDNLKPETGAQRRDPTIALQDMMQTIDALRNVYVEETMALMACDTKTFFSLQDRKIETAQKYHDGFTEVLSRKDEMLTVHPDLKKLFGRKQTEFSKVAAENLEALARMRRTSERLGRRIMEVARETVIRESSAYGASGSMAHHRNKPITTGVNESA
jgi:hypothetical protein